MRTSVASGCPRWVGVLSVGLTGVSGAAQAKRAGVVSTTSVAQNDRRFSLCPSSNHCFKENTKERVCRRLSCLVVVEQQTRWQWRALRWRRGWVGCTKAQVREAQRRSKNSTSGWIELSGMMKSMWLADVCELLARLLGANRGCAVQSLQEVGCAQPWVREHAAVVSVLPPGSVRLSGRWAPLEEPAQQRRRRPEKRSGQAMRGDTGCTSCALVG